MRNHIFEKARDYNFEAIKNYIEQGGNINICNEDGISLFACFIEGYLMEVHACEEESKKELFESHDECDYDFWDSYIYDYQITTLENRNHSILNELNYLLSCGADLNLCKLINGMTETPLYYALIFEDYYLLEYLLEHGADPGVWISDEGENLYKWDKEYFLIEHLDILILNGRKGSSEQNILNMAQLLWQHGLNGWQGGYCIGVDENGVKGYHPLKVKY